MTSGPVVLAVLEGPQAISVVRSLVGATDGRKAAPGTIRGDFGLDQQLNLVHASDGVETAQAEIALFFTLEEIVGLLARPGSLDHTGIARVRSAVVSTASRLKGDSGMNTMTRREVLGSAALVGGWYALAGDALAQDAPTSAPSEPTQPDGPYHLPPLPYDYADLEPYLDAQTMKLHHDVHHAGYVRNANKAIAELERIRRVGGDEIKRVGAVTDELAFHASGHLLHDLFWRSMRRDGGGDPPNGSEIANMITRDFGSIDAFRAQLAATAQQVQGQRLGHSGLRAHVAATARPASREASEHGRVGLRAAVGGRRVGARVLPQVPEPTLRLHQGVHEGHQLGPRAGAARAGPTIGMTRP